MNINNFIYFLKKKKKKKIKVMIIFLYFVFYFYKMVGYGILKNNYISVEFYRGVF